MSGKDTNVEPQKGGDDPINYHAPDLSSSNWQGNGNNLANTSHGMIPIGNSVVESSVCFSAPTVDSFCPPIWDHPINGQNLSYCDVNLQNGASTSSSLGLVRPDMGWTLNGMLRGSMFLPNVPGMVPQSSPHFPTDSDFIERAARFSCFSGGNFGDMMNPLGILDPLILYSRAQEGFGGNGPKPNTMEASRGASLPGKHSSEGSPFKNEKKADHGVDGSGNESNEAEFSGRGGGDELEGATEESFGKGLSSKKRKRNGQDTEHDENNEAPQLSSGTAKNTMEMKQKVDENPSSVTKPRAKNGKQGPQGSDPPKEEYIHIRARRGQATNSHSLAERVRREKISERMKFLQDLVPGCSKVTGKAVMLDEIINYVQSLQRQVEFLSMKLATVNPQLDFNIEGLLAKDLLQPRTGLPFPPDMTMPLPLLHSSQPGQVQAGHFEALRRPVNFQATAATGGFKDLTSRVPSVWEDELHNIVHMGFNSSAPLISQDLSGSLPPGHMKAEP